MVIRRVGQESDDCIQMHRQTIVGRKGDSDKGNMTRLVCVTTVT